MIPISNGWMSNSISYARITEIASTAREHALQGKAGVEVIDHSLDMSFGEKLFDYVCCGSVKKEFMDYLYQMSHKRTETIMLLKSTRRPTQEITRFYRDCINRETAAEMLKINGVMTGNTLKFCRWSVADEANGGDFLIYRNNSQRTTLGIPLKFPSSSSLPTLNDILTTSTPTFHRAGDIQLRHLKTILHRGHVILGGQSYQVRRTKKNEPVVMLAEDTQHTAALQKRLRNLWAIGNVKKRLIDLTNAPLPSTRPEPTGERLFEIQRSESYLRHREKLQQFAVGIQGKFDRAVDHLHNSFISECILIRGELDRIERMTDHTLADDRDFLQFQEKLQALEATRKEATELIEFLKYRLNWTYSSIEMNMTLELLAPRVLNDMDEIVRFFRSRWSAERAQHIKNVFDIQHKFISQFNLDTLAKFVFPSYLASGRLPNTPPKIFLEKYEQLLTMANDTSCTWQQFSATRDRLATELDAQAPLVLRQVEMGEDLLRSLDRYVCAGPYQIVLIYQSDFSSESNKYKNLLLDLLEQLTASDKNFTSVELDDMEDKIRMYSENFTKEHRRWMAVDAENCRQLKLQHTS